MLSFDLYPEYLSHRNIVKERFLFCISYRWLGEKKIHTISILDDKKRFNKDHQDDYYVVSEFRKVLEQADAQVFHHGNAFDEKMFAARLAFHGLPPLPKLINQDTKVWAKKYFRFNSNRLDYLARFLGYKGKLQNPDDLWIKCWEGHIPSLKHMAKYNRQDIDILEYVYLKLRPYVRNNPLNRTMWTGGEFACPDCGEQHYRKGGTNKTRTNEYPRYQCLECGKWFDERTAVKTTKPKVK